jgi:four helix bundle suffix protein
LLIVNQELSTKWYKLPAAASKILPKDPAGKSLETYIRLLGVAEGSFKELAADYEDFLRQKHLQTWSKDDVRLKNVRSFRAEWLAPNVPNTPNLPASPEAAANSLVNLCAAETYMLGRQIAALKERFVKNGGFRENLRAERTKYKQRGGQAKWQRGGQGYQRGNGSKSVYKPSSKGTERTFQYGTNSEMSGKQTFIHYTHEPH